jgi:CBS domain-containing protein
LCKRGLITAPGDTTIAEAAALMRDHCLEDLVVTDPEEGGRMPIGIVTDRDIVVSVVAENLDPNQVMLGDIMGGRLVTAYESQSVEEVISLMRAAGVRRMPIVDIYDELAGIVSLDDLLAVLASEMGDVVELIGRGQWREQAAVHAGSSSLFVRAAA